MVPGFRAIWSLVERAAAALVAPTACAACDEPVGERQVFCPSCAASIERFHEDDDEQHGALVAVGRYGGALAHAIQRLKYEDCPWLAPALGDLLAARCLDAGCAPDVVIPVPLHEERLRERGYNQAALLASRLARAGFPVATDGLVRTRPTEPQATLRRIERHRNLRGAFVARRSLVGKYVMLLDDVTTTGGTFSACEDAVVAAGGVVSSYAVLALVETEQGSANDSYPPPPASGTWLTRAASNRSSNSTKPAPRALGVT
jgi:ComF family protein